MTSGVGHVRLDEIRVAGPESSVSLPGPPSLPWDRGSAWAASSGHLPPSAPLQRPPMTSGSSSGTSGCPTTIMNSRPGDALRWGGGGGRPPESGLTLSSSPAGSQLLTLDTTSIALRLCPVASCPDAYLLAGCEGGCCCWDVRLDQPQKRRSEAWGCPESQSSLLSGCRSRRLTPGTPDRVMPPARAATEALFRGLFSELTCLHLLLMF